MVLPTAKQELSFRGGHARPLGRNVTSLTPCGFDFQAFGDVTSSSSLGRRSESREGIIGGHDGNDYIVVSHNFSEREEFDFRKLASTPRTLPVMKSSHDEETIHSGNGNIFTARDDRRRGRRMRRAAAASMSTSQQGLRPFFRQPSPPRAKKGLFFERLNRQPEGRDDQHGCTPGTPADLWAGHGTASPPSHNSFAPQAF